MSEHQPIVVAAALVDSLERPTQIMGAQRAYPDEWRGYFEFPGGKTQPGETPEEALRRELREELSLEVEIGSRLPGEWQAHGGYAMQVYLCTPAANSIPQIGTAHLALSWVALSQMESLQWLPADSLILTALKQWYQPLVQSPTSRGELKAVTPKATAAQRQHHMLRLGTGLIGLTLVLGLAVVPFLFDINAAQRDTPEPSSTPTETALDASPSPRSDLTKQNIAATTAKFIAAMEASGIPAKQVMVAVKDLDNGASYSWGSAGRQITASVGKVELLAAAMLRVQDTGIALTAAQQNQARKMITISDNDAAWACYRLIGGAAGLAKYNQRLGLGLEQIEDHWGRILTTPEEQNLLLEQLVSPSGPLTKQSQEYILSLLSAVTSTQRWGVGDAGATALKNGWVPRGDGWHVNSIGLVEIGEHRLAVSVLTAGWGSMAAGQNAVTSLARAAVKAVTGQNPAAAWQTPAPGHETRSSQKLSRPAIQNSAPRVSPPVPANPSSQPTPQNTALKNPGDDEEAPSGGDEEITETTSSPAPSAPTASTTPQPEPSSSASDSGEAAPSS